MIDPFIQLMPLVDGGLPYRFIDMLPKPKQTRKITVERKTRTVIVVEELITLEIECDQDQDSCPAGCHPIDPPDSAPTSAAIAITTTIDVTVMQSGSTTVRRGSGSGCPSSGKTPCASAAALAAY